MKKFSAGVALLVWIVAGCATPSKQVAQEPGTAICHVCQYNNDLSCLKVRVQESTPKVEYKGQTLFFCSEECQKAFLKKPNKYRHVLAGGPPKS